MGIESGPSMGMLMKAVDEDDWMGYTAAELEHTHALASLSIPEDSAMKEALARVIEADPGGEIVEELVSEGKWLMAANLGNASRNPGSSYSPVGLMYAEGDKSKPDTLEFSVVRMGIWIMPERARVSANARMSHQDRVSVRSLLYNGALRESSEVHDPDDIIVSPSTVIVPLFEGGDGVPVPFRFVNREDYLALAGLNVAKPIIRDLSRVLVSYHGGEESFQDTI